MSEQWNMDDTECAGCAEEMPANECPKSFRPCGHHCNHSFDHDCCHWCGVEFGEEGAETYPEPLVLAEGEQ